jgi:outer membrane protein OmpA-like peptidoglycan-associated protein
MSRHARFRAPIAASVAGLICAMALGGCMTERVKPTPSQAVLQTRAGEGVKPAACPVGDIASVSPMEVGFGFAQTALGDVAQRQVAKAAVWLKCNPGVEVVILPSADSHGPIAHQQEIAQARAKAVVDGLRGAGATEAVIRTLAMGAPDQLAAPHLVITARSRGW